MEGRAALHTHSGLGIRPWYRQCPDGHVGQWGTWAAASSPCSDIAASPQVSVLGHHQVPWPCSHMDSRCSGAISGHPIAPSLPPPPPGLFRLLSFFCAACCVPGLSWSLAVYFLLLEALECSEHTSQMPCDAVRQQVCIGSLGSWPLSYCCYAGSAACHRDAMEASVNTISSKGMTGTRRL